MTRQECETHIVYEQEKALQRLCAQWLTLHDIYFEADRMDRRTSGKCGRADFRICHHGHWLSCECKVAGQPLTQAQEREAALAAELGGRALGLNPLGPSWWFCYAALPHFVLRDYARAIELGSRTPIIVTDQAQSPPPCLSAPEPRFPLSPR
jgi:hypothetical protein